MPASTAWKPLVDQWIKCNVDGSWNAETNGAGDGWISRDKNGKLLWAGAKKLHGVSSAIESEAEAMR